MQRIAGAVAAGVVVALGLGLWSGVAAYSESLPVPEVGEALAARLADGAPVFVVRHAPDDVSVLSAVSTHLDHVVAWCTDSQNFIEPVGATRFGARGHWLGGPSPTGLAPYASSLSDDLRRVRVGRLGEPPARWQMPDEQPGPWDACDDSEGAAGGVFPPGTDPADARPVEELSEIPLGSFGAVNGMIDLTVTPPRLCGPRDDWRCPADAVRVHGSFWEHLWDAPVNHFASAVRAPFLVRRTGETTVDRVATLARPHRVRPTSEWNYSVRWEERDPADRVNSGDYVGLLDRVQVTGDRVVLHAAGEGFRLVPDALHPTPHGTPRVLPRAVLRRRLGTVLDMRMSERFHTAGHYLAPDRLPGLLRLADEPLALRFSHLPGTRLWSVHVYDSVANATAGR